MKRAASIKLRQRFNAVLPPSIRTYTFLATIAFAVAQQECYVGPGAVNRGPSNLVPCTGSGISTCCLLGDVCLSGNACWNYATGNTYQYGCSDITYKDASCPFKCGADPSISPWTGLQYCTDVQDLSNTWVCLNADSCSCKWIPGEDLFIAPRIGCNAMGSNAKVAFYAPSKLPPYVSLPSTIGGSTGYFSPTVISGTSSWVSTVIAGYTPETVTQLTKFRAAPSSIVLVLPDQTPASTTYEVSKFTPPSTTAQATQSSTPSVISSSRPTSTSRSINASSTTKPAPIETVVITTSSGLSRGAKVGIGVGASGGVCLLAALALFIIIATRHRRRESRLAEEAKDPDRRLDPLHNPHISEMPTPETLYHQTSPVQSAQWEPYHAGERYPNGTLSVP